MLTGKQKRFLRSKAHHLTPIFQVGKGGVNDNMIKQIAEALEARELIKVSVLQNCEEDKNDVAEALVKEAALNWCRQSAIRLCYIRNQRKINKSSFLKGG